MQWDDVRVFLAVAQTGSLRRAARVPHRGQPTIVRHLRRLEQTTATGRSRVGGALPRAAPGRSGPRAS
ncbi:MAG TPA: LysR family transcriptional regulator [Methylomirabilota bacterium]